LANDAPESLVVGSIPEMRKLVNEDVLDERDVRLDDPPVDAQDTVRVAASP
jgi:hypothetical protein